MSAATRRLLRAESKTRIRVGTQQITNMFAKVLAVNRLTLWVTVWWCFAAQGGNKQVHFNRDIRPILSENCFACHGHDKNQRKAKLRLDVREEALQREAIIPGKPGESKLVKDIFTDDADDIMPPPKTHKVLTATQKELLKKWVEEIGRAHV